MINYIAYLNHKKTAIIEVEIVRLLIYLLYRQIRWNYVQTWVKRFVESSCTGVTKHNGM